MNLDLASLLPAGAGTAIPLALMFAMFETQDAAEAEHATHDAQFESHVSEFYRYTAEARIRTVTDLLRDLRSTPSGRLRDTLCEALVVELATICNDSPSHPFCLDRAEIREDAGC